MLPLFRTICSLGCLLPTLLTGQPTLVVIRHGQAEHNVQRRCNSNPQHPKYWISKLTKQGELEAKATATALKHLGIKSSRVRAAWVSPMPRTQQTAAILVQEGIVDASMIKTESRLTELQVGDLEGRSYDEYPGHLHTKEEALPYHAESLEDLKKRVASVVKDLKMQEFDGVVLFVTHKSPAREVIREASGTPVDLDTAGYYIMDLAP